MISNLGLRFCFVVLLLATTPARAADIDSQLNEARDTFLKGVDGDKRAVRDATREFRSMSQGHPDDPVYMAYLGASLTLQGRDAPNGIEKQRLTEEGLRKVDQALGLLSVNDQLPSSRRLETLLVAANSFIHIPAFFNRYERGKRLLHELLDHPDFNEMPAGFKAAAFYAAALVARGNGDEKEYHRYLTLAADTDPQGHDGRAARGLLENR
jgi:hypothetical protein